MIPITVEAVGMELLAARFRREVRAFQAEQRKQMRKAGSLVRREVIKKLRSGSPLRVGTRRRTDAKGRQLGPLNRQIKLRVFKTTTDVGARIEPNRRAFYGRFHETGLDTSYTVKQTRSFMTPSGQWVTLKAGARIRLRLPRRPFLEPTAKATEGRVVDIMGDSYDVFYRGGA